MCVWVSDGSLGECVMWGEVYKEVCPSRGVGMVISPGVGMVISSGGMSYLCDECVMWRGVAINLVMDLFSFSERSKGSTSAGHRQR